MQTTKPATRQKNTVMRFFSRASLIMVMMIVLHACDEGGEQFVYETGSVTDIDGNTYRTVKIGDQWWMAENLKVTSFNSGKKIDHIEDKDAWRNAGMPAYAVYNNISGPGLLYNFQVVNAPDEIAPEGWRVPTDDDWKILEEYLGMPVDELDEINWRGTDQGDQLKVESTKTSGWISYDGVWGTNSTGFSAVGGSCRVFNGEWGVPSTSHSGYWWTSTPNNGYGFYRYLDYKKSGIFRYAAHPNYGFSIRCIKN